MLSQYNSAYQFDADWWVISVIQPGLNSWEQGAMIVVEGLDNSDVEWDGLFVGRYIPEISVNVLSTKEPIRVMSISVIEEGSYSNSEGLYDQERVEIFSYTVSAANAQKMIQAIKADKQACMKAKRENSSYPFYFSSQQVPKRNFVELFDKGIGWCQLRLREAGIHNPPGAISSKCCCIL